MKKKLQNKLLRSTVVIAKNHLTYDFTNKYQVINGDWNLKTKH